MLIMNGQLLLCSGKRASTVLWLTQNAEQLQCNKCNVAPKRFNDLSLTFSHCASFVHHMQGSHKPGKPGIVREFRKPGKVREFEIWSGNLL